MSFNLNKYTSNILRTRVRKSVHEYAMSVHVSLIKLRVAAFSVYLLNYNYDYDRVQCALRLSARVLILSAGVLQLSTVLCKIFRTVC